MIYAFLCASVHNFECWLLEHVATHKSFSFLFGGQLGSFVLLFFLVLECFTILQSHGGQKWTSFNILGIFFVMQLLVWPLFDLLIFILVRKSWHAHLIISNDVVFLRKIKYEFCENLLTFFHTKIFIVNLSFHLLIQDIQLTIQI